MVYHVEKLADLDFYTEGPVIDNDHNFFVTTLSGGKIIQLKNGKEAEQWAVGTCPNGQVILNNGDHWFCDSSTARITAYHPDGSFKAVILENRCAGTRFTTPNDLILDSKENLYFTDSVPENGKVFFLGVDGQEILISDKIDYANGLALNSAEDILYVAESYGNRILAFHLNNERQVTERHTLIDLPAHSSGNRVQNLPDGLALDREGRLWVAHYGMQAVHIISTEGDLLFSIDTNLPLTSNLAFVKDTPFQKQILVTGGYGEPGPGAVMLITVEIPKTN